MDKTVKHRYHPLLFQYHSTNTRSTLQKRLSHSMDNSTSRKPANRTKNLWSTEGDNEKSKHTRKHQRCMDHETWNTSTEKRCIKGNWIWKESTTKWAQQCRCSDWSENADLTHNIIPPEKNAIEQPNDINENGLLKIKKTLVNAYAESIVTPFDKRFNLRKPGRKTIKKLEESLEKVNNVIEATPLLPEKIDVTSLNQLTYATGITGIKTERVENECIIKKKKNQQEKRRLDIQYESTNKWASCWYQQNITNERSNTFTKNEKKYELDENKISNCRWANKIHLTRNTQTTSICP